MTDEDINKEAKPSFYLKRILPILLKTGVVHLLGFGNRLAFDPIPFQLQVIDNPCLLQDSVVRLYHKFLVSSTTFRFYSS